MKGTGGFRKFGVARAGKKAVFPKNEKENLTKAERNALKKRAGTFLKITEQETGYEDTV
jgi:hypothetical protein